MQNDLISRSDAIKRAKAAEIEMGSINGIKAVPIDAVIQFLEIVPAVDAVSLETLEGKMLKAVMQKQDGTVVEFLPVVRCKDCRRCDGFPRKEIEPNEIGICRINRMAVKPDDYCSFGERRADDGK